MKKILSFLLPIALVAGLTACKKEKQPEEGGNGGNTTPTVNIGDLVITVKSTVSTLTFSWPEVNLGAGSMAFNLVKKDDATTTSVKKGLVTGTSVLCDELERNTAYTFTLTGYSQAGGKGDVLGTVSKDGATLENEKLAAPKEFTQTSSNGVTTITWTGDENADSYEYTIKDGDTDKKAGTTDEASLTISSIYGTNMTLTVTAKPAEDSEAYLDSDPATYDLTITRTQVGTAKEGTYTKLDGTKVTCNIEEYDDGSYVIKKFHGNEGYDLEFSINENTLLNILNYKDFDLEDGTYTVAASATEDVIIYAEIYNGKAWCNHYVDYDGKGFEFTIVVEGEEEEEYKSECFCWDAPATGVNCFIYTSVYDTDFDYTYNGVDYQGYYKKYIRSSTLAITKGKTSGVYTINFVEGSKTYIFKLAVDSEGTISFPGETTSTDKTHVYAYTSDKSSYIVIPTGDDYTYMDTAKYGHSDDCVYITYTVGTESYYAHICLDTATEVEEPAEGGEQQDN